MEGYEPTFLYRLWRNSTTMADLLPNAFPGEELPRSWGKFLGELNGTSRNFSMTLESMEDKEVADIVDNIKRTASPVIDRMKEHYEEESGHKPDNSELFTWFLNYQLNNHRSLVKNDLVHGALH